MMMLMKRLLNVDNNGSNYVDFKPERIVLSLAFWELSDHGNNNKNLWENLCSFYCF
jgi:hypothetical protein